MVRRLRVNGWSVAILAGLVIGFVIPTGAYAKHQQPAPLPARVTEVCSDAEDGVLKDCVTGERLEYDHGVWHRP